MVLEEEQVLEELKEKLQYAKKIEDYSVELRPAPNGCPSV